MAGYVRVSREDIRRLARHLDMTVAAFEQRHIVEVTRQGQKRIKEGYKTCQFLDDRHLCTVYEARPADCRGYVCWNQEDETVYLYSSLLADGGGEAAGDGEVADGHHRPNAVTSRRP